MPRRRVRSLIVVLLNLELHVIFAFYDAVQLFCLRTIGFTHGRPSEEVILTAVLGLSFHRSYHHNDTMSLKPGQKFSTPTPGFGDRVFYETLYRQRPDSFMAQEW